MSSFLEQMLEAGERHSAKPEFINVARMKITLGYSSKVKGQKPISFFKPYNDPDDAIRVAAEVNDRLKNQGLKNRAESAIKLNIPQESNMSEKVTWDVEQITFFDLDEDSEYQIFVRALKEDDFPIDKWFWGAYKNIEVGEYQNNQGETKKRFLAVPVEKFENEEAAMKAAGTDSSTIGTDSNANTNKWSIKAQENYRDISALENLEDEILHWLDRAYNGVAFSNDDENYPLPIPATPPKIKKYIADIYVIESSDIDLMIPF